MTKTEYSKKNTEKKLRQKIEEVFGKDHNIKLAIFKATSEYNDEWNEYNPCLILIDNQFKEINSNKINVNHLCPNEDEQSEYYEKFSDIPHVDDVTIKF